MELKHSPTEQSTTVSGLTESLRKVNAPIPTERSMKVTGLMGSHQVRESRLGRTEESTTDCGRLVSQ
jgi:hypothetical protein